MFEVYIIIYYLSNILKKFLTFKTSCVILKKNKGESKRVKKRVWAKDNNGNIGE
jgi:hypothetical protein